MSLVIGVLLPTSMMFPGVDQAFLAGLEGAVGDLDPPPRLIVEPIGAGAHPAATASKIQKLLLVDRPAVITGVMGGGLVPHVRTLFDQNRTPFILCNLGGDLVPNGGVPQEFIFWNSLHLWQSTYALGWWAARNVGRSVGIAAAIHEAGYGIVNAFMQGFVEAGGGRLDALEVTHRESATEDPSEAVRRLAAAAPDFVFGLYSGREGVSFMNAFTASGLAGRVPLLSTAMMTHGHWLPAMGPEIAGTRTACSWVPGTHADEERKFAAASAGRGTRPAPDVFALLGYEAGLMIAAGLARAGGSAPSAERLNEAMAGASFSSPRGAMCVDSQMREVTTVDRLIEIIAGTSGTPGWRALDSLPLPERYQADADEMRRLERKTGWLNAYLVN